MVHSDRPKHAYLSPSGAVPPLSLTVTPSLSVVPQSNNQATAGSPTYLGEGEDEGVCVC